jgi:hypothetical protein
MGKTITVLCAAIALATTTIPSFANSTGNESNNPYVIQGLWPKPDRRTSTEQVMPKDRIVQQQNASAFERTGAGNDRVER